MPSRTSDWSEARPCPARYGFSDWSWPSSANTRSPSRSWRSSRCAYRAPVGWEILLTVPAVAIQVILLTGLGFLIAPVVVLVRDVDRVVRIVLRFLFYATPVLYGLPDVVNNEQIPTVLQALYALNPMTGIIALYRSGFFPDQLQWAAVLPGVAVSLAIFAAGWWVFARLEHAVLKEI